MPVQSASAPSDAVADWLHALSALGLRAQLLCMSYSSGVDMYPRPGEPPYCTYVHVRTYVRTGCAHQRTYGRAVRASGIG